MMTDFDWSRVESAMLGTWHRGKWPEESKAFYRGKLERFDVKRVLAAIDTLGTKVKFLPTLAEILTTIEPASVNMSGVQGAGEKAAAVERKLRVEWCVQWIDAHRRGAKHRPEVDTAWRYLRGWGITFDQAAVEAGLTVAPLSSIDIPFDVPKRDTTETLPEFDRFGRTFDPIEMLIGHDTMQHVNVATACAEPGWNG